ncbi:MAG: biotin--[acetyl-CoA-carboxylase] ligase [Pseudomonadota bacterium]
MISDAPVYWFEDIDSTSEEAKRRARSGDTSPVWIAAREQLAGRGRLGRQWNSPIGNLYTTALFPEPGGLAQAARVPFAAALAVRDACAKVAPGLEPQLKWPNDVRVEGAKLSGILTESGETNGVIWIALGMGINVRFAPEAGNQASSCLLGLGANPGLEPEHVLEVLRGELDRRLKQARDDFERLLEDWLKHAEGFGQTVEAGPPTDRVSGVFEGLAPDGGLILRLPDGQRQTIRAGDVDLVRQVD